MEEEPPVPEFLQPNGNMTCEIRVDVHSGGLWGLPRSSDLFKYPLTLLQLQLAIIFIPTQFLHILLKRFHLPRFTSQLLVGIILGPTICGQIPNFAETFFPPDGCLYIDALSKIGYIFFRFLCGVKMNPKLLFSAGAGSMSAWTIGTIAPLIPFAGGISVASYIKPKVGRMHFRVAIDLIGVQNLISFPVIFSLLKDLKIMNSELGRLALTSGLISDIVSDTLMTLSSIIKMGYAGWKNVIGAFNILIVDTAICIIVLPSRPLSRWIIAQSQEGRPINRAYISTLCAAVFLSSLLTDNAGLLYHNGPFILGLAMPDGPPLGSALVEKLETINCGLFAPLLVTIGGMRVNLVTLFDLEYINIMFFVIICCLIIKVAGTVFSALACKMPVRDAFALACIMGTQGIVQMFHNSLYSLSQAFDEDVFAVATVSILLIASGMQVCVYSLYDHSRTYAGYEKRDVQHSAYNAELRVLVISSRADDAFAIKKMLEASFSNIDSPLAVYSLSLVELVGRVQPLLIDHQLCRKLSKVGPHVPKILEIFQSIREQYMGIVSVSMYTALSLPRFMHDDICSLAFDKMASLIILPFHMKWNNQGKIMADNGSVRAINCRVLNLAPCSVGILIDRHRIKSSSDPSSTYNVTIIFLSGNDDREALAYGKRMARSPGIHLTVVRFVPLDTATQNQWDAVMDAEMLKDLRLQCSHQDNIVYREETVKDGAETALQIRAMEERFDLILVGRRHRDDSPQLLGLNEWNDLPEMGPIGDMLAASEIKKPVSVLVIQQQIVKIK